jgi:hypothetical protein
MISRSRTSTFIGQHTRRLKEEAPAARARASLTLYWARPANLLGKKGDVGRAQVNSRICARSPREKCGHRLGAAAKTNSDPRRCASGVAYAANGPVGLNGTIQGYVSIIVEPLKQEHPILSRVESMSTTAVGDFPEVTSPVAGISTDLLTETRLARTAAGFLVDMTRTPPKIDLPCGN